MQVHIAASTKVQVLTPEEVPSGVEGPSAKVSATRTPGAPFVPTAPPACV
jgi:hypothetical protein